MRGIGRPWIVALNTIGRLKRLAMMRLHQLFVLQVMAVNAECGSVFGHVIGKLTLMGIPGLMNDVARVAATVQRRVAAAPLGYVDANVMASEAEVLRLVTGHRLQKQRWIVRLVRVVALQAIPRVGRMNETRDVGRVLVFVAGVT